MAEQTNKPKKITLFNIRTTEIKSGKDKGQKKSIVQFSKDVKITYKGQEVDLGEYGTVFLKKSEELAKDLEYKLNQGWISEEVYNKLLDYLEQKNVTSAAEVALK